MTASKVEIDIYLFFPNLPQTKPDPPVFPNGRWRFFYHFYNRRDPDYYPEFDPKHPDYLDTISKYFRSPKEFSNKFKITVEGINVNKNLALLDASRNMFYRLEQEGLIPSDSDYDWRGKRTREGCCPVFPPKELNDCLTKLNENDVENTAESYGYHAKDAKRRLQDLCKFLAIPIPFENKMQGAKAVDDKTAQTNLSLRLPVRRSKSEEIRPLTLESGLTTAKGENESIQKCSLAMVKQLVDHGWLEAKTTNNNIVEELTLKKMNIKFKDDIQPTNIESYNLYGGHTESSAAGRLAHFCQEMGIMDPELIEDRKAMKDETWLYTCDINLKFKTQIDRGNMKSFETARKYQKVDMIKSRNFHTSEQFFNLHGRGIAEQRQIAEHRAKLQIIRQLYQMKFIEPECSCLHCPKHFNAYHMTEFDKQRFGFRKIGESRGKGFKSVKDDVEEVLGDYHWLDNDEMDNFIQETKNLDLVTSSTAENEIKTEVGLESGQQNKFNNRPIPKTPKISKITKNQPFKIDFKKGYKPGTTKLDLDSINFANVKTINVNTLNFLQISNNFNTKLEHKIKDICKFAVTDDPWELRNQRYQQEKKGVTLEKDGIIVHKKELTLKHEFDLDNVIYKILEMMTVSEKFVYQPEPLGLANYKIYPVDRLINKKNKESLMNEEDQKVCDLEYVIYVENKNELGKKDGDLTVIPRKEHYSNMKQKLEKVWNQFIRCKTRDLQYGFWNPVEYLEEQKIIKSSDICKKYENLIVRLESCKEGKVQVQTSFILNFRTRQKEDKSRYNHKKMKKGEEDEVQVYQEFSVKLYFAVQEYSTLIEATTSSARHTMKDQLAGDILIMDKCITRLYRAQLFDHVGMVCKGLLNKIDGNRFHRNCRDAIIFFWYIQKNSGEQSSNLDWNLEFIVELVIYVIQTRYIMLPEKAFDRTGKPNQPILEMFTVVDLVTDIFQVIATREFSDNSNCGEYLGVTLKSMRRTFEVDEHAEFDKKLRKITKNLKSIGGKSQTEVGLTDFRSTGQTITISDQCYESKTRYDCVNECHRKMRGHDWIKRDARNGWRVWMGIFFDCCGLTEDNFRKDVFENERDFHRTKEKKKHIGALNRENSGGLKNESSMKSERGVKKEAVNENGMEISGSEEATEGNQEVKQEVKQEALDNNQRETTENPRPSKIRKMNNSRSSEVIVLD